MKRLLLITLSIVILNSCEKQPFDSRNKYVGDYEFTSSVRDNLQCCLNQEQCCSDIVKTVFNGKIDYGSKHDLIIIDYAVNVNFVAQLNFDGTFKQGDYGFIGAFDDNGDVSFSYRSSGLGSGYYSYTVDGKKIN